MTHHHIRVPLQVWNSWDSCLINRLCPHWRDDEDTMTTDLDDGEFSPNKGDDSFYNSDEAVLSRSSSLSRSMSRSTIEQAGSNDTSYSDLRVEGM